MFDYETHPQQRHSRRRYQAPNEGFRRQLNQLEKNVTDLDLDRFVNRVNRLLETYVPEAYAVSREEAFEFDRETILYYQGEGIIDTPSQARGWNQEYGFRQILQALLLKKMLVRGLPLRRIAFLMTGMDNEVYKRLLERDLDEVEGFEIEPPRLAAQTHYRAEPVREERYTEVWHEEPLSEPVSHQTEEYWRKVSVYPGLEIHISQNFRTPMSAMETKTILNQIQKVIESRSV